MSVQTCLIEKRVSMLFGKVAYVNFPDAIVSSYMADFSLTTNMPDKCFSLSE